MLNALHENFADIPNDKSLDFFGNGNQISYQRRADILIREIQNSEISIPEAINTMQIIGFSFDNGISYNRSDISSETKSSSLPKTGDVIAWKEVSNWYKVEGYTDDSIILHAVSSLVNFADICLCQ